MLTLFSKMSENTTAGVPAITPTVTPTVTATVTPTKSSINPRDAELMFRVVQNMKGKMAEVGSQSPFPYLFNSISNAPLHLLSPRNRSTSQAMYPKLQIKIPKVPKALAPQIEMAKSSIPSLTNYFPQHRWTGPKSRSRWDTKAATSHPSVSRQVRKQMEASFGSPSPTPAGGSGSAAELETPTKGPKTKAAKVTKAAGAGGQKRAPRKGVTQSVKKGRKGAAVAVEVGVKEEDVDVEEDTGVLSGDEVKLDPGLKMEQLDEEGFLQGMDEFEGDELVCTALLCPPIMVPDNSPSNVSLRIIRHLISRRN